MTIESLISDYWEAWYQVFQGNPKGPAMIDAAKKALIEFHYDELDRVREESTPATRADLRRYKDGW